MPNLPLILVAGQVLAWLGVERGIVPYGVFVFRPYRVLQLGEWWRLGTFVFAPPPVGILWSVMAWWAFYFIGSALEAFWGAFRVTAFVVVGYILTVIGGLLTPFDATTNFFLGSIFLAFAYLNPDFEILLFFILPVRIKWLGLLTWIGYVYVLVWGSPPERAQVLAVATDFLLFFGRDLWLTLKLKRRTTVTVATRGTPNRAPDEPRHRCRICNKTDRTNPEMDFRYCSLCAGDPCYCPDHIFNHEHVTAEHESGKTG